MKNTFTIEADIKRRASTGEIVVVQNDSIRFIVAVFDNGNPFDLSSVETVSLANTLSNKQTVVTPGTIVGTNTIQFDLGTNETQSTGGVNATVQLYDSEGRVSTISFSYKVVKDPTGDDYVPSETEQTLIEVVLNDGPLVIQDAQDQANYAKAQGDYAKQVADENKTNFLAAVATVADRDTTYPTPSHGDTVRVTSEAKTYRYVNGTGWVVTDEYNPTAIDEVNAQISETKKKVSVVHLSEFIDQIPERNVVSDPEQWDWTPAIKAGITKLESRSFGGRIVFPEGNIKVTDTITINGANQYIDDWGKGGIAIVGDSIRGTRIIFESIGKSLFQLGTTESKVAILFQNISLRGNVTAGSIAIDSRTVGGSYVFNDVLVDSFDVGIRYYDNTLVSANHLNVRNCNLGLAMGYYSDVHSYRSCRFDFNKTGIEIGYYDSERGQSSPTESHAISFETCIFNVNDIGAYIHGSGTEAVTFRNCYFEQYSNIAIRLGEEDFSRGVNANVVIDNCFFNGYRQIEEPTGKKPYAIEINRAGTVDIRGGGFRNHTDAPINIRHNDAKVKVGKAKFDNVSGELGDIKLPDGNYLNVDKNNSIGKPAYIGRYAPPKNYWTNALPAPSSEWLNSELIYNKEEYICGQNKDGSYSWFKKIKPREHQYIIPSEIGVDLSGFYSPAGKEVTKTTINDCLAYRFTASTITGVTGVVNVPKEWDTFHIGIIWTNEGTGSGTITWVCDYTWLKGGVDITSSKLTKSSGITLPSQNIISKNNAFANIINDKSAHSLSLFIKRDGVSDSNPNTAILLGVVLIRVS